MFNAIGMDIFAGSFSIGVMNANFNLDRVLEISDEMLKQNAKHFIHNYNNIPVIAPSKWNNPNYLLDLKDNNYDLMFGNPPCSGLSNINRNASVDNKVNQHLYEFVNVVNLIEPKTFILENAPTLISRGKPILNYLVRLLSNKYKITIIRDYAGNHRVPMKRQRTLVVGFRNDICSGGFPDIHFEHETITVGECLSKTHCIEFNQHFVPERTCKDLEQYYDSVQPGDSIMSTLSDMSVETLQCLDLSESNMNNVMKLKHKLAQGNGAYEKSPSRLKADGLAPSLASVVEFIHPTEDRPLYVGEYAKLMGYPNGFEFVDDAEVPYVQAIAQGVPVNFAAWIAKEVYKNLVHRIFLSNVDGENLEDKSVRYVNSCKSKIYQRFFTTEDFLNTDNICK